MYVCTVHTTVHVQHQTHLICNVIRLDTCAEHRGSSPLTEVNSPRCAVSNVVACRGLFPVVHLHCRVEGGSIRLGEEGKGEQGRGGEERAVQGEGGLWRRGHIQ